ncbi:hypothetical protein QLQ77_gp52 [Gordonia phage Reyja]|uniref:Uncharacterized protein n=1 Tax=Gordonia phage Reyja TaxID=2571250 RepID=A0A4D6T6V7_9CAUD|nr:hypothetical protein QLQ77_gp52 [Gordonia phage Reyja]QCG77798.1 hypothetical protein SEA_REYJA_52 [Gordonia phage Reyja]
MIEKRRPIDPIIEKRRPIGLLRPTWPWFLGFATAVFLTEITGGHAPDWLFIIATMILAGHITNLVMGVVEYRRAQKVIEDEVYPETLAVAKLIYENLPSEDPGGGVEPWDELTDEQRAPFMMNARNLGHVFPDEYPKLAAELAQYRAAQNRDKP